MKKVRSYINHMAKANIELASKEIQRIDIQVGLHRTKEVVFGSYVHEWSKTKGKEKKPPEQVHYWNGVLSNEIEAEVDLYIQHLFLVNPKVNVLDGVPILDYVGDGFENPGVTVLFGGDHGDKHCPISCKLNLSPPAVRKGKGQLGYQCPVIVFASVQCTKDAYDLMDNTVMPKVKEQLTKLKQSSVVTVYHRQNVKKAFRSYMVPSTIRPETIGFLQGINNTTATMMFSHGEAATFGSVSIDDPVFAGVPYFELAAKVVINEFNELFIGDLAFLAIMIGINNSAGSHCLMCT